jgi:hypothetical protein
MLLNKLVIKFNLGLTSTMFLKSIADYIRKEANDKGLEMDENNSVILIQHSRTTLYENPITVEISGFKKFFENKNSKKKQQKLINSITTAMAPYTTRKLKINFLKDTEIYYL